MTYEGAFACIIFGFLAIGGLVGTWRFVRHMMRPHNDWYRPSTYFQSGRKVRW